MKIVLSLIILSFSKWSNAEGRGCLFDTSLSGKWFQSGRGDRHPVVVNSTHFAEGKCVESGKSNRFLVYLEREQCHKCMVINMKHHNVIQYKESFCDPDSPSLIQACHGITGDAVLFTMFRLNAKPVKCPFSGPLTFTYSKGYGECTNPVSQVDSCADESRLLFRQQACADVPRSESIEEDLLCLGGWKDGANRYLAGKINHRHANTAEDQYRCFIYEKPYSRENRHYILNEKPDSAVWYLSVSADATCQGLVSAHEGSKTMKLKKASHGGKKCKFPSWLSRHQKLHSLDFRQTYFLYHRNTSLKITNGTRTPETLGQRGQAEIRLVCHHYDSYHDVRANSGDLHVGKKNHHDHSDQITVVVHFTQACRSGYKCMRLHRRDNHIIQAELGQDALTPEEACNSFYFESKENTHTTLVSNQEEPVDCGVYGKYSIISPEERCAANELMRELTIGCSESSAIHIQSKCSEKSIDAYQCLSHWDSEGVQYIVASPVSRGSGDPRRVCFSHQIKASSTADEEEIVFMTHHSACSSSQEDAQSIFHAKLLGQCVRASSISSSSDSFHPESFSSSILSFIYYIITMLL